MRSLGIADAVRQEAGERANSYPVRSNWASQIGDPCERYLVYMRTAWQERPKPDARLQMIFDLGRDAEDIVRRRLDRAGIKIIRDQEYVDLPAHQISGKIDGMVHDEFAGIMIPVEIKSASGYNFDKLAGADDVIAEMLAGARYMQRYPGQLLLYMYAKSGGHEWKHGAWIFFNKITGEIADRVVELDPWIDYCDDLLSKADRVNDHVRAGTLPDRVTDYDLCDGCDFAHICLPDRPESERIRVAEDEVALLCDQIDELEAEVRGPNKRLRDLKAKRKKYLDDLPEELQFLIAGEWHLKRGKTRWNMKRIDG
jgi:hypothetical protein